jgi:hypothetical protein
MTQRHARSIARLTLPHPRTLHPPPDPQFRYIVHLLLYCYVLMT